MIPFDDNDLQSLALCAWKEARGEGCDGIRAVMHVILHRAIHWYGNHAESVHAAVYAKNQFTSMSVPTDPEFNLQPAAGDAQFAYCLGKAPIILKEEDVDITQGALYYGDLKYCTSGWFWSNISGPDGKGTPAHPLKATIGKQAFFG
jgi:Cell Wall Hydrolase